MTQATNETFVPRAPRFEVTDASEISVTVTRSEGTEHESFTAKLVDVSQHGTKLQVPVNFRFEDALQLKIEIHDSDLEYHGVASVRHIRAVSDSNDETSDGGWVIGCAIAPPLSDKTFAYLATSSGKERRRSRRVPITAAASVRRQTQTIGDTANLLNLSSGGFCFFSTTQYESGESIQIDIEDIQGVKRIIDATICWQVDSPDGYISGCQFSTSNSYADLCACLTEQEIVDAEVKYQGEPTSKLVLTTAVLAMFVPPMMTLMLQANKVSAEASETPEIAMTSETEAADSVDSELEVPPGIVATIVEDAGSVAQESPTFREWIDNTGKHRTQAKLVDATDEHVILEKHDGKQAKVPWRRLSATDQEYVKSWREE